VLIAPPRFHLLRFHGVLAPRSRLRPEVVPLSRRDPEHCGGPQMPGPSAPETRPTPSCGAGRLSWAALMKRVFEIDVLLCPRCGGRRRIVAGYTGGQRLRGSPCPARAQRTHGSQGLPMIGPERYARVWSIGNGIDIPRRPQGTEAAGAAAWEDYRPRGRLGGRRVSGSIRSDKVLDIAEPQGAGSWLNTGWGVGVKVGSGPGAR